MRFFDRLTQATLAEQEMLYTVPQLVAGLAGRIDRHTYLAYLAEAYHHVRHTVPLLCLARDRLDLEHRAFAEGLDVYVAEETGHEQWILNDIRNAGGDADAVATGEPSPATELMVAFAYDYVGRVNPMGMFGMVFVLEGTSVALASRGAASVATALDLGPDCFSYLTSHGGLDQEHMRFFADLMNKVAAPSDQASIIHMAKRMFGLFGDMFRAIPMREQVAHAV